MVGALRYALTTSRKSLQANVGALVALVAATVTKYECIGCLGLRWHQEPGGQHEHPCCPNVIGYSNVVPAALNVSRTLPSHAHDAMPLPSTTTLPTRVSRSASATLLPHTSVDQCALVLLLLHCSSIFTHLLLDVDECATLAQPCTGHGACTNVVKEASSQGYRCSCEYTNLSPVSSRDCTL